MTITTTPKSSPTQNPNKSGGESRDSSISPPAKVARTSSTSTSYHSSKPESTISTSANKNRSSSPTHTPHKGPKDKSEDPYHFSTKKETKFDLEQARALLKANKDRVTKSPTKVTPTERKHPTTSLSTPGGGTITTCTPTGNAPSGGGGTPASNQLSSSTSISSTPTLQNGKLSRGMGGASNLATPPALIPSMPPSFREENNNYNGSNTSSIGGSSAEENNNALPAEYWLNRQPLADQIVITDVTVCDMTVTIRECKTKQGFFRERDHNMPADARSNAETETTKIITVSSDSSTGKALINTNTTISTTTTTGPLNKANTNSQNGAGGPVGNSPAAYLHRLQQQSATAVSSGK